MTKQIKLGSRGRITLPKDVLQRLGWNGGTQIEWVEVGGQLLAKEAKNTVQRTGKTPD